MLPAESKTDTKSEAERVSQVNEPPLNYLTKVSDQSDHLGNAISRQQE